LSLEIEQIHCKRRSRINNLFTYTPYIDAPHRRGHHWVAIYVKDGRKDISIRSHVALTHILNAARIEIVVLGLLTINSYRVL